MEDLKSLKQRYPQKFCLKILCRLLYYFGCGDCWYEEKKKSSWERKFYPIWAIISKAYLVFGVLNEYLAFTRTDLTGKEKNDLMQHTFGHSSILAKVLVVILHEDRIKVVFKRFLEDTRSVYSSSVVDNATVSKTVWYCGAIGIVCFSTLATAELDGVRAHITEGIPIRTEVTFYPKPSQSGIYINILRFIIEFHWWYLVSVMMLVEYLAICSLIFLEAKFKLLQMYFRELASSLEDETKTKEEMEKNFKERFIVGVKLHEDALWCATNIQHSLGNIYSVQVFESISLIVMCLIKIVTSDRTLMLLFANMAYIICMVVLTGTYMMTAGDITHEASTLSTAMFHCGWEMYRKKSDILPLLVVAIQRSQAPVCMTAFGIIELSYVNFISWWWWPYKGVKLLSVCMTAFGIIELSYVTFISVLRLSYSFFAVMY